MLFVVAKLYIETLQNFFFLLFFRPSLHVEYEGCQKELVVLLPSENRLLPQKIATWALNQPLLNC